MKRGKDKAIINAEPNFADPVWQQIRSSLYMLYLQCFSELSACSELSELEEINISARDLELWKPILYLAAFFDKYNPQLNLLEKMRKLACRVTDEKHVENVVETSEYILVETLSKLVKDDGYFPVKTIRDEMAQAYDEEQRWLTTKWVGNALRRLGFKEKRRVGRGVEYHITLKEVRDLSERLGLKKSYISSDSLNSLSTLSSLKEALETLTKWLIENKDSEGLVDAFELTAKIQELGLEPRQTIEILKGEGWLVEVPRIGKLGVAK